MVAVFLRVEEMVQLFLCTRLAVSHMVKLRWMQTYGLADVEKVIAFMWAHG